MSTAKRTREELLANQPKTPQCDNLRVFLETRNDIVAFLEWCSEKGYSLCKYEKPTDSYAQYFRVTQSNDALAHEYLEIDEVELERERAALLEWMNEVNEAT